MQIYEKDNKKFLMIHKWKEEYLNYQLDDYIVTFDDGLYSQYKGCFNIIEKFPDIQIIVFISTNIVHDKGKQTINESTIAHNNYFNNCITNDFLTYNQILELSRLPNVTIGLHGHNHLNIHKLKKTHKLKNIVNIWKEDVSKMLDVCTVWKSKNIIKQDIYYCTPYNIYDKLLHAVLKVMFNRKFQDSDFFIIGAERVSVYVLTNGEYNEQYT